MQPNEITEVLADRSARNGSDIVMCTSKNAPKLRARRQSPTVALTLDAEVHVRARPRQS